MCEHRQETEVLPMIKPVEENLEMSQFEIVFSCAFRNVEVKCLSRLEHKLRSV